MAASMGPPMLPGYSLRVQLFSPTAHELTDKPIRCFRVVTSPEVTIREFCEEASRIHEINYGEPLAIKKVQDDQEFDVTQSEIVGNLFANTATIRVVQASTNPAIRDSIPPTSALRFDPATSRKRDRSSPNGVGTFLKPPKRQRIAELDPDQPLPSREMIPAHANGYVPEVLVPNSQESIMLGSDARYVRPQQIEETPEPPALQYSPFYQNGNADRQSSKKNEKHTPTREISARAQSHGSNVRSKSASYHIQRATERGTSVSTAATSPPSVEGQRSTVNGHAPASKWKGNEGARRSLNEDNIYDTIVSEDEGTQLSTTKKLSLKARNSPGGLPGIEWAKAKASNTPPSTGRRSTASRELPTTPGELPLTPSSKEREARRRERKEQEEARKARLAAAEAAEQRQRETEEARLEEERRVAEAERAQREEEEARQVEEFNRAEAERKAKAEKLRKEKNAREAREAEEARIAKVEADRRQKETEIALRRVEENRQEEIRVAEKEKMKSKPEKKDLAISDSRQKVSSPILPGSASRVQSSTPHIPKGKPNGLKSILKSSSPARPSPEQSTVSKIGNGTQSAKPRQRTISFDFEVEPAPIRPGTRIIPPKSSVPKAKTPIQPPKRTVASKIVPPPSKGSPASSSKHDTPVVLAKGRIAERSASPMIAKSLVPHSTSAIVPPTRISPIPPPPRKISSIKPTPSKPIQSPAVNEQPKATAKPKTVIISDEESEDSDEESVEDEDMEMVDAPPIKKENHSPAKARVIQDSLEEDEESESSASGDEDVEMTEAAPEKEQTSAKPNREDDEESAPEKEPDILTKPASKTINTPQNVIVISSAEESEEEDPDATQSQNSSPRESRSPVIFSQNPSKGVAAKLQQLPLLESEEDERSDHETTPRAKTNPSFLQEESTITTDSESSEDEGGHVLVPKSSPPLLHSTRKTINSGLTMSQISNRSQINTQNEVDNQLTSSLSRPHSSGIPASSIANRPPMMKFGASLSSLSQQKNLIGTSSQTKVKPTVNGLRKMNDEESESEEESDKSSSSSEDDNLHVPVRAPVTPRRKQRAVEEDSDSTSTSDSDEEKEKSDSQRVRDELSKRIASVMASSEKSSKKAIGTQSASKLYGKEKKDKYLTGYSFSQPGI